MKRKYILANASGKNLWQIEPESTRPSSTVSRYRCPLQCNEKGYFPHITLLLTRETFESFSYESLVSKPCMLHSLLRARPLLQSCQQRLCTPDHADIQSQAVPVCEALVDP